MKKFLLSMLTLLGATSVWAQSVTVPATRVAQQRTNVLKVTLSSASDTRDLQFDLTLPEGISLVENAGTVLDAAAGHVIQYHQAQTGGPIRFVVVDALVEEGNPTATSADAATYGKKFSNGVLVEIPVLAAADFTGNPAVAHVTNLYISNDAGKNVSADPANFDFNIFMNLLGDVDENGAVEVTDVLLTADVVLNEGVAPANFKNREAGNIELNDVINVTDVLGIADIILSGSNPAKEMMEDVEPSFVDTLDPQ